MPITFDPQRAMHLAGTVGFPTPYPEPGWISVAQGHSRGSNGNGPELMVRVEHVQSNRLRVSRTVPLSAVEAVHFADDPANPHELRDRWVVPAGRQLDSLAALNSTSCGTPRGALAGTVFVKEATPVLMEVQVGMTAAESAEYYPPVCQERSDAHYNLMCSVSCQQ
jgi:hypothetical protein